MSKVYSETLVLNITSEKESKLWLFLLKILTLVLLMLSVHYIRGILQEKSEEIEDTNLAIPLKFISECDYKIAILRQEIEKKFNILEMNLKIREYQTDDIGLFDYAAEYAGGQVISTPETKSYPLTRKLNILGAFDLSFFSKPQSILLPSNYPGECYAFWGFKGQIVIRLGMPVIVTKVSLQHVRFIGSAVNLTSAPKDFKVWGYSRDEEWILLGSFEYDLENGIIQTFPTVIQNETMKILKLEILNNHGNEEFTCVYRFRAHSIF